MKLFKNLFHCLIALFCGLLITFIAIIVVKQIYLDQFICKKEIQKIIQHEVKSHFLQVSDSSVIINGFVYKLTPNTAKKFEENLSILIEQNYKKSKDSLLIGKAKTSPIVVYPENNNNSNYILTSRDLENIKEYVKYLTEKVDTAVKDTSDEVNKSIDKLNLWMTVWMGILAIIGIFMPLFLNYNAREEIKDVQKKAIIIEKTLSRNKTLVDAANEASKDAKATSISISEEFKHIKEEFGVHQESTKILNELVKDTQKKNGELENTISKIVIQNEKASNLAQEAIIKTTKTEKALEYLHILSSFKTLDFQRIRMTSNGNENKYLSSKLTQLKKNFEKCKHEKLNPSTDPIFKEFLNDFIYSIYQLSFYLVAKRDTFKVLFDGVQNALVELRESNENNLDIAYSKLDSKLGELIEVINRPIVESSIN